MSTQTMPSGGAKPADASAFQTAFIIAWLFCLLFYFMEYAVRSAPSVMLPELRTAFGLNTAGLSSLIGLYYYSYAAFAIVAGASVDRWGAKYTIPAGVLILAAGTAMFGVNVSWIAPAWGGSCRAPVPRSRLSQRFISRLGDSQRVWLVGGLLFLPTTVFAMTWGVSFLPEGWQLDYPQAVDRAASVAMGWVFGCPLLGYIADHIGRRKPVILAGAALMLAATLAIFYLPPDTFPP